MQLTNAERAILANQNRILAFLNESNADQYNYRADVFEHGYERLYEDALGLMGKVPYDVCKETTDILNMYRDINTVPAKLTDAQKQALDLASLKFEGFDANEEEGHYSFVRFLIEQNRYQEYADVNLNSHDPRVMRKYRLMLDFINSLEEQRDLTPEDLPALIKCAIH